MLGSRGIVWTRPTWTMVILCCAVRLITFLRGHEGFSGLRQLSYRTAWPSLVSNIFFSFFFFFFFFLFCILLLHFVFVATTANTNSAVSGKHFFRVQAGELEREPDWDVQSWDALRRVQLHEPCAPRGPMQPYARVDGRLQCEPRQAPDSGIEGLQAFGVCCGVGNHWHEARGSWVQRTCAWARQTYHGISANHISTWSPQTVSQSGWLSGREAWKNLRYILSLEDFGDTFSINMDTSAVFHSIRLFGLLGSIFLKVT